MLHPSTFSIVAYDPANGDLGIAVESKFLAVGAVVPWAVAGVGAIATQSWANTAYGPRGLRMLKQGLTPQQVGARLIATDQNAHQRQFGIVDAKGRAFTYTGTGCFNWAGGVAGENFAAQGNILVGAAVVDALAETFEIILAETEQGRGILGVIDGVKSKGVEDEEGVQWRKDLLRRFGYKL